MSDDRFFFHPERGWGRDSNGAVIRLEPKLRRKVRFEAENALFRAREDGSWERITDAEGYSKPQLGLSWEVRAVRRGEEEFVSFRGPRVVDKQLRDGPLEGLTVYDQSGNRLAEPLAAGRSFLLGPEDARTFSGRARELGADLRRQEGIAPEIEEQLAGLRSLTIRLSELVEDDLADVQSARAGDFSAEPELRRRQAELAATVESARQEAASLRQSITSFAANQLSEAEAVELAALSERAEGLAQEVEGAHEAHQRAEGLFQAELDKSRGKTRARRSPAAKMLVFADFAEVLREEGIEVAEDDEISFVVQGVTVRLGPNGPPRLE